MKLLLDQNISHKLVKALEDIFPDSNHVYLLDLHTASDEVVWNYAKKYNYTIVTQDSDFNERSILYGYPPKIIWLRINNTSTQYIEKVIRSYYQEISFFEQHPTLGCLQVY